jgi:phage terminase large subunit-like protein
MSKLVTPWTDLKTRYGTPTGIPDDELYTAIAQPGSRHVLTKKLEDLGLDDYLTWLLQQDFALEVRRRAKADLYFLSRYILWETNPESAGKTFADNHICDHVHRRLCDMFVHKDDSKPVKEQDLVSKERLILYPRGSMKSTVDVCDAVQWILNFPNIRILFLTAADDLAVGFVDETKGHFVEHLYEKSLMNLYFPEFCVTEKDLGNEARMEFTCPLWKKQGKVRRERTLMSASITATLSGLHFEVIKGDDIISNRNSESEEQCKKIIQRINVSVRKMLRPFGYFDAIGTRYADEDYYGEVIEKNVGELVRTNGPCWERIDNTTTGLKILIGRAWELKPDAVQQLESGLLRTPDIKEEHYDLLFPEVLTYSFLRQEQSRDEISFEGQYNQNPRPASSTPFPRALLVKSTLSSDKMPFRGPISQTWDFAFSKKKGRDYSTASCAVWNEKGQCFIVDLIRGRFLHNDLAKAVVDFAMKWRPFVIGIEDAGGSKFLEPAIISEAQRTCQPQVISVCSKIDWVTPDNIKDAKKMRMAALHPWLMNDRLKFAEYLPHLDALYSEFERCLHSHHHDDIPDVISRQTKYAPAMQGLIKQDESLRSGTRADAAWHLLYEEGMVSPFSGFLLEHNPETGGLNWVTQPLPNPIALVGPVDVPPPAQTSAPGLDPILGSGIIG